MRLKNRDILPRVLMTIANAAIAFGSHPSRNAASAYKVFRTFDELQDITDKQLRQCVRHAIRKKYITIAKQKGGGEIEMSEEGKRLVGRAAIHRLRPVIPAKWDRKWRIVIFDIPEIFKKSRDSFAGHLKGMGFTQLQKSVFVFPHPCLEEVDALADLYDIREYVTCIVAESIENDGGLRIVYDLPSTKGS